ncbi:hypothetical protein CFBP498_49220 (plasmid) [Xanthomonas hortorum pv. vitians]|uniref:UmuC domain-containing protein n=1 Tax=Xanthomonas hortorum pv. vitians TaxID=83224 RepID=A0A6V7FIW0_9XANT|nr:hypothetical protein [Xanthomonas hortorum]CAD0363693.1 hypothetical protein CFBP498_49220 [Xanthomonas hortorum pv. vitians]CAD0363695.1 hypothetical protein CFBP498_49220 [Xanthomonas hortorum pv. vitians]
MFALIDGNNFYASCERVFQPELRGRPLVVLSNNDGYLQLYWMDAIHYIR